MARLALVGGFELTLRGRAVALPERAERLIAFLAIRARPIERQQLAGMLWLDSTDFRATANLRSMLWRIRDVASAILVDVGHKLMIDERVAVDVHDVTRRAYRILDGADPEGDWVQELSSAGDLLPDWDEDWVVIERERLHQLRLHALELMCERLMASGRFGWAIEACLAAVSGEPLRESAQRALIRVYLAEGNPEAAIAHYRAYQRLMLDELGLEPSSQLADLVRGVDAR